MAKQKKKVTRVRRRERKNIDRGHAHIQSTFNNTIITLTDVHGNAISWASSGQLGFKGSKNQLHLLLKWWQKLLLKLQWNMV